MSKPIPQIDVSLEDMQTSAFKDGQQWRRDDQPRDPAPWHSDRTRVLFAAGWDFEDERIAHEAEQDERRFYNDLDDGTIRLPGLG